MLPEHVAKQVAKERDARLRVQVEVSLRDVDKVMLGSVAETIDGL